MEWFNDFCLPSKKAPNPIFGAQLIAFSFPWDPWGNFFITGPDDVRHPVALCLTPSAKNHHFYPRCGLVPG